MIHDEKLSQLNEEKKTIVYLLSQFLRRKVAALDCSVSEVKMNRISCVFNRMVRAVAFLVE